MKNINMKQILIYIVCGIFAFLAPIQLFLFLALYLVLSDALFAIIVKKLLIKKQKKLGLPEDLTMTLNSTRFSKSGLKLLAYMGGLIMGLILDQAFAPLIVTILGGVILQPFVYVMLLYIVVRELWSINETLKLSNNGLGFEYYISKGYSIIILVKNKINDLFKK